MIRFLFLLSFSLLSLSINSFLLYFHPIVSSFHLSIFSFPIVLSFSIYFSIFLYFSIFISLFLYSFLFYFSIYSFSLFSFFHGSFITFFPFLHFHPVVITPYSHPIAASPIFPLCRFPVSSTSLSASPYHALSFASPRPFSPVALCLPP